MQRRLQQQLGELASRTPDSVTGRLAFNRYKFSDLPVVELADLGYIRVRSQWDCVCEPDTPKWAAEKACQSGSVPALEEALAAVDKPTTAFLHHGLTLALAAGHVETAEAMLDAGAPIMGETAGVVLDFDEQEIQNAQKPTDSQIKLLNLLLRRGWDPNVVVGHRGATLLPRTACRSRLKLLRWLLAEAHADPDLADMSCIDSDYNRPPARICRALEKACEDGCLEAVQLLLDAGSDVSLGHVLYSAVGRRQPESSLRETDSKSRIAIMDLLAAAGADANKERESLHADPQFPIVRAVVINSAERVRWLLAHGANPRLRPTASYRYGNALEEARNSENEEIRQLMADWEKEHPEEG